MANGKKRTAADRDVADPTDFLDQYFRERGIRGIEESPAGAECVRRAEDARERFKLIRTNAADVSQGASSSEPLSAAEKYTRRLVNNRKSAAAARVFQEVLKKEQAYTLYAVVDERDQMARELARSNAERDRIKKEAEELRALVKKLQSDKMFPTLDDKPVRKRMQNSMVNHQYFPNSQEQSIFPELATGSQGSQKWNHESGQSQSQSQKLFADMPNSQSQKLFPDLASTQSQTQDDQEEKGSLRRPYPPPPTMISSQLSQGDIASNLRCSIGSDDLPGDEIFFPGSQPFNTGPNRGLTAS